MTTTTPTRDELSAFPCNPLRPESRCSENCIAGDSPCERRDVYRAHIALRAAVLGDMTGEEAAYAYRSIAAEVWLHPFLRNDEHFTVLADVTEGL